MGTLDVEISDKIAKKVVNSHEGMTPEERFIAEMNEQREVMEQNVKNGSVLDLNRDFYETQWMENH